MATTVRLDCHGLFNPDAANTLLPISQCNAKESLLLRLPAELRNKIYAYVLGGKFIALERNCDGKAIGAVYRHDASILMRQKKPLVLKRHTLELLRVCRQTYADTRTLPFTLNTIHYKTLRSVMCWLKERPYQVSLISQLLWDLWTPCFSGDGIRLAGLSLFEGLMSVQIWMPCLDEVQPSMPGPTVAMIQDWESSFEEMAKRFSGKDLNITLFEPTAVKRSKGNMFIYSH